MTFEDLQTTLGETLDPKEWTQFTHRDGTPGGWIGEGATVDHTVQMDPTAIVHGAGTRIGEFVILGPQVQVEGGAFIYDGPELTGEMQINGPVAISGRRTQINGTGVKIWWNAPPEALRDEYPSQLVNAVIHGGSHISGRVYLMQTEARASVVSNSHEREGPRTQSIGTTLHDGSTLKDGALAVNSYLSGSTATGFGTQVIESSLNNTVAPLGQRLEGQTLGGDPTPAAHPPIILMVPELEEEGLAAEQEEELPPPRRHRGHRPTLHTGFRRCQNQPGRHGRGEGLGR